MTKSFADLAMIAYRKANVSPSAGAVMLSMAQYADWWGSYSRRPFGQHPPRPVRLGIAGRDNWWNDGKSKKAKT